MPASDRKTMRVYVPATVSMLRDLVDKRELHPVGGTAFALTPALREAYASGDDEELAEVAMAEAARASLRLLADEVHSSSAPMYRRAVIAVDVTDATLRPDLDDAVVKLDGPIEYKRVGSVHMDLAEAESAVAEAVDIIDAADLGDEDAEFVLGDAEDHQLAWYATQELPFLLDLL